MKLSEIKTELFTRVSLTSYGVRFEIFDKESFEKINAGNALIHLFLSAFHILDDGNVNINCHQLAKITFEQLEEIQRVSKIIKRSYNLDSTQQKIKGEKGTHR